MPTHRFGPDLPVPTGQYLRVAIYTRQSRSSGDEFSSCDAQFEICHTFLMARQWQGWIWCGTRYDDEGESGERLDRPAMNQLLQDVCSAAIDIIVVHRLDRLSRKLSDCSTLLGDLRDRDVQLHVVADPMLGTSAMDTLVLNILGSFAEFEREIIRERLADTRAAMKRKGLRVAGRVPFGYGISPTTKQLVPIAREAKRVRAMFAWASEGKLLTEIAGLANERRWKTKPSSRFPMGGRWTPRQVAELLANPVYIGMIRVKNGTAPGSHDALIDKDLFDRVREIVAARRVPAAPRKIPKTTWPLRGLVVCARCGRPMSTSVLHHQQFRYLYYRCRSHAGGRPPCKGVSVSALTLEQMVCHQLADLRPEQFRLPGRRELIAAFTPLWKQLDERDQVRTLPRVVQKVAFGAANGKLRIALRPGAVDYLARMLANHESEPR